MIRSVSQFLVVPLVLSFLVPFQGHNVQAQEAEQPNNPFIERLQEARRAQEVNIRAIERKTSPNIVTRSQIASLKYYDYAIENAKELIAEGGTFGKDEYDAAIKLILAESRKSLARVNAELMASNSAGGLKRDFDQMSQDIQQTRRASVDASKEKYRTTVDAAELKFKFSTSGGQIGLVIWNLPLDQSLHPRSTPLVNIRLFNGAQAVWKRVGLRLNRNLASNPVRLPNVMFDRVMIEMPRWIGSGNGLAEVQVFVGKENVALGRPCEVSSIETLPMHLDDQHALTDGITNPTQVGEGYWIPEERTKASATIYLLGKKVESSNKDIEGIDQPATAKR
ncbi:MAG: hypothetical protein AB8B91_23215 [Rubripirellula sp.]